MTATAMPMAMGVTRPDAEYETFVAKHQARTTVGKLFWLGMHLLPGLLAYIGLFHLREPLMAATGWSNETIVFLVLASMALGWHIGLTFLLLRYHEGLNFRASLAFVGLTTFDWRGNLTVLPLAIAAFTLLSVPYMTLVHPLLYDYLNAIPAIAIAEWHPLSFGYYSYPPAVLALVLIGNFFGEEIYFRGYLMKKIAGLKGDWLINSLLFQAYHIWQAPMNWSFIPFAPFIPLGLLIKWRKSLYICVLFHLFVNTLWSDARQLVAPLLGV